VAWKRLKLGVVDARRLVVVAASNGNAVLGAFQLRLQREKILVRLQVRITSDGDQQPPEGTCKCTLRILILLEPCGIDDRRSVNPAA